MQASHGAAIDHSPRTPTLFVKRKATQTDALRRAPAWSCEVVDPGMRVSSLHGNREISRLANCSTGWPVSGRRGAVADDARAENPDSGVLALKPANKAGQPAAEWAERRLGTEGNTSQPHTCRAQHRGSVPQGLERVRQAAKARKKERFTDPSSMALATLCRQTPKVGAVCPNRARTDLCGGYRVTGIPTAIDWDRSGKERDPGAWGR